MQSLPQNKNHPAPGLFERTDRMAEDAEWLQAGRGQAIPRSLFFWVKLLLCVAFPFLAIAEENNSVSQYYTIKVWGADEGLLEASVTDVAQTPEGYLWVGTLFGSVL
jgi:hypothetical protein